MSALSDAAQKPALMLIDTCKLHLHGGKVSLRPRRGFLSTWGCLDDSPTVPEKSFVSLTGPNGRKCVWPFAGLSLRNMTDGAQEAPLLGWLRS